MPSWSTNEIQLLSSEIEERQRLWFLSKCWKFPSDRKKVPGPVFARSKFMQLVICFR